jgi:hypothetical protein
MMGGYWGSPGFGMMRGYGSALGILGMLGIFGIVLGVGVIASALMLHNHPTDHSKWGILILVLSILSIFGNAMGGLGVGLILGVIGGMLALTWKPPAVATK